MIKEKNGQTRKCPICNHVMVVKTSTNGKKPEPWKEVKFSKEELEVGWQEKFCTCGSILKIFCDKTKVEISALATFKKR